LRQVGGFGSGEPTALAVDPRNGNVYAGVVGAIDEFDSNGRPVADSVSGLPNSRFGSLAVDSAGDVFATFPDIGAIDKITNGAANPFASDPQDGASGGFFCIFSSNCPAAGGSSSTSTGTGSTPAISTTGDYPYPPVGVVAADPIAPFVYVGSDNTNDQGFDGACGEGVPAVMCGQACSMANPCVGVKLDDVFGAYDFEFAPSQFLVQQNPLETAFPSGVGPSAMTVDSAGNVYLGSPEVGGPGGPYVFMYDSSGNFLTRIGEFGGPDETVNGVAVDSSGTVYVSTNFAGVIAFTPPQNPGGAYTQSSVIGGTGAGDGAIAVDPNTGDLWVADPGNSRIEEFGIQDPTSTTLTSSANPATTGTPVSYTATIIPASGTATGTVAFTDGGATISGCSAVPVASGQATCTTTYPATGVHTILASYTGSGNFIGSMSSQLSETVLACGASLTGCNLAGGNLAGADLANVQLPGANLKGATLTGANLSGANLKGANLSGANLSGANLSGAILKGANLSGVVWSNTTCPDGTNSNNDQGTCLKDLTP
jgi:hypothetical protein